MLLKHFNNESKSCFCQGPNHNQVCSIVKYESYFSILLCSYNWKRMFGKYTIWNPIKSVTDSKHTSQGSYQRNNKLDGTRACVAWECLLKESLSFQQLRNEEKIISKKADALQ